jgi:hypothetical protein
MANPTDLNLGMTPDVGATKPAEAPTTSLRYVDRPELQETFADSVSSVYFDGQSLRIEFGVTRLDEVKNNSQISGRRYPAARLVLTPGAAADLINRIQQVASALTQAGILKPNQAPGAQRPPG